MKVIGYQYCSPPPLLFFSKDRPTRGRGASFIVYISLQVSSNEKTTSHQDLYIIDQVESRSLDGTAKRSGGALYRDCVAPIKCSLGSAHLRKTTHPPDESIIERLVIC